MFDRKYPCGKCKGCEHNYKQCSSEQRYQCKIKEMCGNCNQNKEWCSSEKQYMCYRKQKSEGFAVEISGYICLFITPFVLDLTEKLLPMLNCVSSVIRFVILFLVIYSASVYFICKLYK